MSNRKPYVRSMDGWWLKNPFYVRYMLRESTSVFVAIYALILLVGLWRLDAGPDSYGGWLAALTSPVAIVFHLVALAAALYHTVTWFAVAPKVAPMLFLGGRRVPEAAIVAVQYLIALVLYTVLLVLAVRV